MFTQKDVIDVAIQIEKNGEAVYRDAAGKVANPAISTMLLALAEDEAEHRQWFSELVRGLKSTLDDPEFEKMMQVMLRTAVGDKNFALKEADFTEMESVRQLAEVSIEFEQDTILFYEMLKMFVDDPDIHQHLDLIIEEEKHHVRQLQQMLRETPWEETPISEVS